MRRSALVACEIFFRELCHFLAGCPEVYDAVFLPKGLHDLGGEKMRQTLQAEIDRRDDGRYCRIVLGYCLCNNGAVGLTTKMTPLVVPRAHDCLTLFLGSRQRYEAFFRDNPGTYVHTTGWLERGRQADTFFDDQLGPAADSLEAFIARYGEDNGKYLWETIGRPAMVRHYRRIAYISLPIPGLPDLREESRSVAAQQGWDWMEVPGDEGLLRSLVWGPYDDDRFLMVAPGEAIAASHDGQVLCRRCPATPA